MHTARGNRLASLDQVSALKPPLHLGTGFGPTKNGWNNNIWASSSRANAFTEGGAGDGVLSTDSTSHSTEGDPSFEGKTGSGSLLSTSESDCWNGRSGVPWPTSVNDTSPIFSRTNSRNISPLRQRTSEQSYLDMSDVNNRSLSSPSVYRPSFGQMPDHATQHLPLNSRLNLAPQGSTANPFSPLDNTGFDAEGPQSKMKPNTFNGDAFVSTPSSRHYADAASDHVMRNGTVLQPITASRTNSDMQPGTYFRTSAFPSNSNASHSTTSRAFHRHFRSTDDIEQQDFNEHTAIRGDHLASGMEKMNLRCNNQAMQRSRSGHRPTLNSQTFHSTWSERSNFRVMSDEQLSSSQTPYVAESLPEHGFQYPPANHRTISLEKPGFSSSSIGDSRRELKTPYTTACHPPVAANPLNLSYENGSSNRVPDSLMSFSDMNLRSIEPYPTQQQLLQPNPLQMRSPYQQQSDLPYQAHLQMNPLARPYAMPPYPTYPNAHSASLPQAPYTRAEQETSQMIRSALLEDFRSNSKTNKRYELKDIYNHVVEFSGDQHGSRFIQQKLETANSDEKDQLFGEIQPNSMQLMTDIYGNYVVQKFFEHGSQPQKKILANQMKGHVMALSTQSYGCRVVQKALEHVLVDQQASIVKELENNVLRCVKDQNGNHVIQKAIERVPARHIQFIISAFHEQVQRLAMHPYGCRVIQRMLEHCKESARQSILAELHGCVPQLIGDQYGNYVIQHVIENGEEKDRSRIITVVMSQLYMYSKHKFASNVVEKSLDFGGPGQKAEILRLLTATNDKGESLALALIRDPYGNYVIRKSQLSGNSLWPMMTDNRIEKVLGHLKGAERESLVEQIRAALVHIKKFSHNKQIIALEKIIYSTDTESNPSASSQCSSIPSTNASTVEDPIGSAGLVKATESEHTSTPIPAMAAQA